jgi:hypothetical protein
VAVGAFVAPQRRDATEAGQLTFDRPRQSSGVDIVREGDDREDAGAGRRDGETTGDLQLTGELTEEGA